MSEATRCQASILGAHRFEARYSESSKFPEGVSLKGVWGPEMIETLCVREKRYEMDICVKCGEVRKS